MGCASLGLRETEGHWIKGRETLKILAVMQLDLAPAPLVERPENRHGPHADCKSWGLLRPLRLLFPSPAERAGQLSREATRKVNRGAHVAA
jgi:hypothetical protein